MGNIYSVNEGNYVHFPTGVKKFIKWLQELDERVPFFCGNIKLVEKAEEFLQDSVKS